MYGGALARQANLERIFPSLRALTRKSGQHAGGEGEGTNELEREASYDGISVRAERLT